MKSVTEMIEVMTAYDDGDAIEFATNGPMKHWQECECPQWDWANFDYRVRPKRKIKLYQALCKNGYGRHYATAILYKDEAEAKDRLGERFVCLLLNTEVEVEEW